MGTVSGMSPDTTINARFSDPAAVPVGWDDTEQALASAEMFWLCTVRSDGRPHVTPLVAAWSQGALWFCTGATEQKYVNLSTNPHVVLTTGNSDWDRGIDVVVEGEAVRVTDDAALAEAAQAFAAKWDGRWQWVAQDGCFRDADGGGEADVFSVAPVKVFAHAKGDPFGQTRHRF